MKMQSMTTIAKRFLVANLLAATLFLSENAANVTTATDKAEVKYTGVDKFNQLSFNVKYNNPTGNTFTLTVLDESGEAIYKNFYGDKQFDKTFKLPKGEVSKLTFVIEDIKTSYKEKFDVSVKTQVIEDVIVKKN
jgi:hypothetical protein